MLYEKQSRIKDLAQVTPTESPELSDKTADTEPSQKPTDLVQPRPARSTTSVTEHPITEAGGTPSEHETLPYTIDNVRFTEKMKALEYVDTSDMTSDRPLSVSETGAAMYPKAPRLPNDATNGICPLCGELCPADIFLGHKWK